MLSKRYAGTERLVVLHRIRITLTMLPSRTVPFPEMLVGV